MDRWFDCTQRNYTPVGKYQNLMCQIIDTDNILYTLQGPKLAGATSPNATKLCIRRLRLQKLSPLVAT